MKNKRSARQKTSAIFLLVLGLSLPIFRGSAFESTAALKVSTILKTTRSWDGKPIAYPQGKAEITGMLVEIAPGAETGWHLHPVPSFGMVLEGELEVRLKDGRTQRLKVGEALAEVVDVAHNGRNVGAGSVKLVVFYAGKVGGELTRGVDR